MPLPSVAVLAHGLRGLMLVGILARELQVRKEQNLCVVVVLLFVCMSLMLFYVLFVYYLCQVQKEQNTRIRGSKDLIGAYKVVQIHAYTEKIRDPSRNAQDVNISL